MTFIYKEMDKMKNAMKKFLCAALVVVMCLTSAPLQGFVDLDWSWLDFSMRASALAETGQCGDNVYYSFDQSTGKLIISGTGDMWDYSEANPSPFEYMNNIYTLVISEGVTELGKYSFKYVYFLETIYFPKSIDFNSIDFYNIFINCYELEYFYWAGSVSNEIKAVYPNGYCNLLIEYSGNYNILVTFYWDYPYDGADSNPVTPPINIYNLGEETYSFKNFKDLDSRGHCFGMSSTSAGYYLGLLPKSNIGLANNNTLYSFELTDRVKTPICHYQEVQGQARNESIVAGGTSFKYYPLYNAKSDWKAVVDYVKDHKHDGKGDLIVGYTKKFKRGGHAVNFLRYEVVDGQERIYVYDNNFPHVETYFYQDSNGDIKQAPLYTYSSVDTIALVDVKEFFNRTGNFVMAKTFYALSDTISIDGAYESAMWMGDTEAELMMYEILDDETKITITPLVENATFTYMGSEYSFNEINEDTYAEFTLSTAEEDEPLFEIKNEPHEHIDSEWIVDKDSTCSVEGSKHIECTVCEKILKTEPITKLPHSNTNEDRFCDECGIEMTCPDCNRPLHKDQINAYICLLINLINLITSLVRALV